MRTVFFIPPLTRMSGGLAAIYELAEILSEQGHHVAVTTPGDTTAGYAHVSPAIKRLPWPGIQLCPSDIWCVPEGWPNAIAVGVDAGAHTLVYVQNWIFMLGNLPHGVQWRQLPVSYLAVSEPVRQFMKNILGLHAEAVLPPAINPAFFSQKRAAHKAVHIAWMPRKNRALAQQVQQIALACLQKEASSLPLEFIEIHGKSVTDVAALLAASDIFLSSGFPEGFALPPAEAMAMGCVPVGFTGLGGYEYMQNPTQSCVKGLYEPPFAMKPKPWGANGFFTQDGDVLHAGMALAQAAILAWKNDPEWQNMRENGKLAANAYSKDKRTAKIAAIWPELIKKFAGAN